MEPGCIRFEDISSCVLHLALEKLRFHYCEMLRFHFREHRIQIKPEWLCTVYNNGIKAPEIDDWRIKCCNREYRQYRVAVAELMRCRWNGADKCIVRLTIDCEYEDWEEDGSYTLVIKTLSPERVVAISSAIKAIDDAMFDIEVEQDNAAGLAMCDPPPCEDVSQVDDTPTLSITEVHSDRSAPNPRSGEVLAPLDLAAYTLSSQWDRWPDDVPEARRGEWLAKNYHLTGITWTRMTAQGTPHPRRLFVHTGQFHTWLIRKEKDQQHLAESIAADEVRQEKEKLQIQKRNAARLRS